MSEDADGRFFDLLMKTLNYSIEFANTPGYASLRFMDLFASLAASQPLLLSQTIHKEFYDQVREKTRIRLPSDAKEGRERLMNELIQMFLDEWKSTNTTKSP